MLLLSEDNLVCDPAYGLCRERGSPAGQFSLDAGIPLVGLGQ